MTTRYNSAAPRPLARLAVLAVLAGGLLVGCSGRDADLDHFIDATKKEPGGRVEPLPEVKPYEAYTYTDQDLRSPFVPGGSGSLTSGLRPDSKRNREFLEQFSLDTLKMVGTLSLGGNRYGLVSTKDGRVHRVVVGEHIGTNDGKITDITPSKIALVEIIPDGLGGYIERPAALGLNE
ncbi:MAG TPA: pilus assembly protein PilP [Steroidobacteraceae bacterium]|jgi:type IV pilus assembly protein PilP|nr:pilus assembly protein PilP [Steroidobacteraceae bacterium]